MFSVDRISERTHLGVPSMGSLEQLETGWASLSLKIVSGTFHIIFLHGLIGLHHNMMALKQRTAYIWLKILRTVLREPS